MTIFSRVGEMAKKANKAGAGRNAEGGSGFLQSRSGWFSREEENPHTIVDPPFWPSGPPPSVAGLPDAAGYLTPMPIGSFPVAPAR